MIPRGLTRHCPDPAELAAERRGRLLTLLRLAGWIVLWLAIAVVLFLLLQASLPNGFLLL